MRIGILQTGHVHSALVGAYGEYPAMFERLLDGYGFSFRTWPVVDMAFPPTIDAADGWLLTGSRHGAYEDLPFIPPLEKFIRAALAGGVPIAGICFGHQIMAQALGGRVAKSERGWGVGAHEYRFGDRTLRLNAWHQDQVVDLPPGATVIGTSAFCPYAALAYGERAYSVQAHPEIRNDYLAGLIEKLGPGVVPEDRLAESRERIGLPLDDRQIAADIAAFFQRAGQTATSGQVAHG